MPSRNSSGSQSLPAEAVDVGRVRVQRGDAGVEGVGGVDAVLGAGGVRGPHRRDATPGLESVDQLVGEDPPVAGVAYGVEHRLADGDVVGLVEVAAAEGVAEVAGDHDLGPVPAHHLGDRGAQRHAVLQDAVREAQELHHVDADQARGLDLLGLAQRAALVGGDPVDAGLAAGHHAVDDVLALPGPAGDRRRRRRTRCRRGAPPRRARAPSPRAGAPGGRVPWPAAWQGLLVARQGPVRIGWDRAR